ncbi:MAG: hypothetical protein P8J50_08230 [Acidimicrobiales bacterium]|jgi:hypothetical protein|nr:hypothetical protein [Acidimicrobiales bacterium]
MTTHQPTRNILVITAVTAIAVAALLIGLVATSAAGDTSDAPVEQAPWCDDMMSHYDDWDGFLAEAAAMTPDDVGMLGLVSAALASNCPAGAGTSG